MAIATVSAAVASPSCAATGYERQVLSLFGGLDEGAASCGCTCGAPDSMTCAQTVELFYSQSNTLCLPFVGGPNHTFTVGDCYEVQDRGTYLVDSLSFSSGDCTPQPTQNLPEAQFTQQMVGCETNEATLVGCTEGAVCVPDLVSPLQSWCVYSEGDQTCPDGPYTERTVYYESLSDSRSCSACTCGDPSGQCEGGGVNFFHDGILSGCNADPATMLVLVGVAEYGSCVDILTETGGPIGVSASEPTPVGSCTPSSVALQGSVTPSGAVTVCCVP
jgi:hypothetical protein